MKTAIILVTVLIVLAAAAGAVLLWVGRPLYAPGNVRAGRISSPLDPPAQTGVRPGFVRVAPGVELAVSPFGAGPIAFAIHGGPGFPAQAPWVGLRSVEARRKLIYYHQRGSGASTRPFDRLPNGGGWRAVRALDAALGLAEQIADIERMRRLLGEDRIVLIGHSFGALLACLYAVEFPEHTKALMLLAPADLIEFPPKDGGLYEQVRANLPESMTPAYEAYLKRIFDFGHQLESDEASVAALNREFVPFYAAAAKTRGFSMPNSEIADNGGFMVIAAYLGMGRRHDYRSALRAVSAKVLIVHGSLDLQPEATTRRYLEYFPNARYTALPGVGHAVPDAPELMPLAQAFLDEI